MNNISSLLFLLLTTLNDKLVAVLVLLPCLVSDCGFAPRCNRCRSAHRGLALTAAVRVVNRVHGGTPDGRPNSKVSLPAGLTYGDVLVVKVSYLSHRRPALLPNHSNLSGRKLDLRIIPFLRHELSRVAGRPYQLGSLPGF